MSKEYEVYVETDYGLDMYLINANNAKDMMTKLKELVHKDDIGADGWYIHPVSENEVGLNW